MASRSPPRPRWRRVPAPKRGEAVRLSRRGAARSQGRARQPGVPGERQDQGRGRRRSAGDDRHRRFRGRAIAHAVRHDHALGTRAASHVRAVASARRRRRDLGVQFSGRGVVVERVPRRDHAAMRPFGNPRRRPRCARSPCSTSAIACCERHRAARRFFRCSSTPAPSSRADSSMIGASRWCRSPARRRSVGRSACALPNGSARACSSSAATTRSSSMNSANLDLAVPAIVFGAVGTAGQRCTTTRRVLVHRSRAAELERRLVAAYGQVRIGDPLEPGTLMGPLIDAGAVARYLAAIAAAKAEGGDTAVRRQGAAAARQFRRARDRARLAPRMAVVRTETFAPILYLMAMRRSKRPLALQNSVAYGLSSAVFTDGCRRPNASCRRRAATAASPTSIWAPPAPKSAAHSAARRTPAAAAKRARIPGRPTCGARPTTINWSATAAARARHPIRRLSAPGATPVALAAEPGLDLGGALLQARRRNRPSVLSS